MGVISHYSSGSEKATGTVMRLDGCDAMCIERH